MVGSNRRLAMCKIWVVSEQHRQTVVATQHESATVAATRKHAAVEQISFPIDRPADCPVTDVLSRALQ